MKPFNSETWQKLADFVLAPLVAEAVVDSNHNHYWEAQQGGILSYHFPAGVHRDVFLAVQSLIMQSKAVHITTLQAELDTDRYDTYLTQMYTLYQDNSTLRGQVFSANVDTLKDFGERAKTIKNLRNSVQELTDGGANTTYDKAVSNTIRSLINSGTDTIENETAIDMAHDFQQFMSEAPDKTFLTGVNLIDRWTQGFTKGEFVGIAAPMKQRKTSLTLNIIINMARQGNSVALMMFESNKRMVNAMLVAMFAIEWLIKEGHYNTEILDSNGKPTGMYARHISADALVKLRANYVRLGTLRTHAINAGIAELKTLERNLRIYDRTKNGGSLTDVGSAERLTLRDKALFDTDFVAIDHAQRMSSVGSDYEKLNEVVPPLESLARREGLTVCLLAQLKADQSEGTGNTHTAGIRGGTVFEEAIDKLFITGYKQKYRDSEERRPSTELIIGLQHARYGESGTHMRDVVDIDPYTGWILKNGRGRGEKV